jgi:hypothetical protein
MEAVVVLEEVRQLGPGHAFVLVVARDQWHRAVGVADPADDRRQHAGQFGCDQQQPLLVGLRGHDLQQRNEFAGVGQPVGDDRELG